jgi:DrrA phosphatidylinositol 4-phosphate binding domain
MMPHFQSPADCLRELIRSSRGDVGNYELATLHNEFFASSGLAAHIDTTGMVPIRGYQLEWKQEGLSIKPLKQFESVGSPPDVSEPTAATVPEPVAVPVSEPVAVPVSEPVANLPVPDEPVAVTVPQPVANLPVPDEPVAVPVPQPVANLPVPEFVTAAIPAVAIEARDYYRYHTPYKDGSYKKGRIHFFPAGSNTHGLKGDQLKTNILDNFAREINDCDSKEKLDELKTRLEQSVGYANLKKGQGIMTRFLSLKTSSIQALENMIAAKEQQLSLTKEL